MPFDLNIILHMKRNKRTKIVKNRNTLKGKKQKEKARKESSIVRNVNE